MNKLSPELKQLIRQFASDRLPPTPTAALIKTLQFKYEDANDHVVYLPRRLEVTTPADSFTTIRFDAGLEALISAVDRRVYYLDDFLPIYWIFCANTMDR